MRAAWVLCVAGSVARPAFAQALPGPSTAFYYGQSLPPELATAYEQVVVQPEHVSGPAQVERLGAQPVAYVSVGELPVSQAQAISASWVLARNSAWSTLVMNLADAGYRAYTLARIEALWQRGYHRFFLDTLDSYQLGVRAEAGREEQRRGLVELVRALKAKHPEARLLINRGFELLPEIAPLVSGVVAESLFDRWDAGKQAYTRVPEADRGWLLERLREVRARYRLPVTVIDYRPAGERAAARDTARRIAALGFEPWVCDGMLRDVGVGRYEILPRRVLVLTDAPLKDGASLERGALDWLAPILEYQGYFPELRSVHAGLPEEPLAGRYAGVISWFDGASLPNGYGRWMLEQIRAGTHFAVFGALGLEPGSAEARELGVAAAKTPVAAPASGGSILSRDALIGFEAEPPQHPVPGVGLTLEGPDVRVHLAVRDQAGQRAVAIATTAWGGLASSHAFGLRGFSGERAWVVDPFAFLTQALALPVLPVPDVTTENGRRLALFLIEPEGLLEHARQRGRPLVWTVLRDQLLARYRWPHAVNAARAPAGAAERAVLPSLMPLSAAYEAGMTGGETTAQAPFASLTRVQAMATNGPAGLAIPAPIAWDSAFMPAGAEGYAYQRVLETLQYTDSPRRLKPVALHYHAYLAASPGGLDSLRRLYAWLETQALLPIRVEEYSARVQAFREQVLVRELDGAFSVHGGSALRTLRLPAALGEPDLAASSSVAALRTLPQGRYLSFAQSGPRRLVFGQAASNRPHLIQTNGQVEQFEASAEPGGLPLLLDLSATAGLQLELAGMPRAARCELVSPRPGLRLTRVITSADGRLVLRLAERQTGPSAIRCEQGNDK